MGTITYLATSLVAQVRVESDLVLSQVFTDTDLANVISDAGSQLYDDTNQTNQKYNIATFDFTLVGGVDLNSIPLPLDFQQGHSIDVNPTSTTPFTLRYLPNWLNRNSCNMPFQVFGNNFGPKAYTFLGSELIVLPAINANGTYRLYYTPTWTPLMIPQPVPGPTPVLTSFEFGAGGGLVSFTGTAFTPANVGDTMISTGDANSANNFVAAITSVASATVVQVDTPLATEGSPAATITIQPQGTRPDLPQNMNPWVQYIKTQACITVRNKRGQPVDSFEARLAQQQQRIQTILQERQEEPTQAPWLRRDTGWGNEGGGLF